MQNIQLFIVKLIFQDVSGTLKKQASMASQSDFSEHER